MPDREKVINHLQIIRTWAVVDRNYGGINPDCCDDIVKWIDEALELLKEQEPVKPTVSVDTWICSKCGHTLESQELIDDKENPRVLVHEQYEYCPCCGRKVKWDD